jgi:hypothetical protein
MQGYERICSESGTFGEKCLKWESAVGNALRNLNDGTGNDSFRLARCSRPTSGQ